MKILSAIILLNSALIGNEVCGAVKKAPSTLTQQNQSVLFIDNENNKELDILIKPELIDDKTVEDSNRIRDERLGRWVTARIPENTTVRLEIPQREIGECVPLFSVTGETNPLTPLGTCYNLKVGSNYLLRFSNNPVGTDCVSTEIIGDLPKTEGRHIKIPYTRSKKHHARDVEYSNDMRPSASLER